MSILELKNIKKSYFLGKEEFPVLKGLALSFDKGDFVSILGESGGGKSTLMNIIGGLDRKYDGEDEARFHVTTPKTDAGTRIIPMLSAVKRALLTEYNYQLKYGFCDEVIDGYSGFIFQNRYGSLFTAHDINRAIERIYKAHNEHEMVQAEKEKRQPMLIRHFTAHNLRHTFCTRFCENETNLKVIQEIMGHADIETTMNIYAEATAQKKQESFANLEGKIKIA